MSYKTTEEFLKMFGYSSLDELPELPRYKMDENHQIVIEELEDTVVDSNQNENLEETAVDFNNQSQKENLEEENV